MATYQQLLRWGERNDDGLIERSASGEYAACLCFGKILIYRDDKASYFPVAELATDFQILGITGNHSDRFEKLGHIEKVDIGTLVTKLRNKKTEFLN